MVFTPKPPIQKAVGTTAVPLAYPSLGRKNVTVQNTSAATIYLGFDNTVTSTNGYTLLASSTAVFTKQDGDPVEGYIYAIAGSSVNVVVSES